MTARALRLTRNTFLLAALLAPATPLSAQDGPLTTRQAAVLIGSLAAQPAPARLSPGDRAAWIEHSSWLQAAAQRLLFHAVQRQRALAAASARAAAPGTNRLATLDREVRTIRQTMENEGRRFRTLPRAARVRHDAAMNAIRNMKG